ncbi:MAG TPA: hypothetical protein VEF89_02170 [Solirubrobacteraceae bacterium]|nr:hypothetical protein [Solirubrobacteraceae bacterium]
MQLEVRTSGERPVDHRVLKDDTAHATSQEGLAGDVVADQFRRAVGRPDGGGEHPDRRRLARAVRPEQAEHLAPRDFERDPLHGLHASGIRLAQTRHR